MGLAVAIMVVHMVTDVGVAISSEDVGTTADIVVVHNNTVATKEVGAIADLIIAMVDVGPSIITTVINPITSKTTTNAKITYLRVLKCSKDLKIPFVSETMTF